MNGAMNRALWRMEWRRMRNVFLLLFSGCMILSLISLVLVDNTAALTPFLLVWPFLSGLLLSAGIVSDDMEAGVSPMILALPVSRSSLWLSRVLIRLVMFVSILAAWYCTLMIAGIHPGDREYNFGMTTGSPMLIMCGLLMFAVGLICTTMMRNTFESAIAAGVAGILAMGALRSLGTGTGIAAGYTVTIVMFALAGRDLFLCREPFEWHALRLRALGWIAGISVILIVVTAVI